jgi:hypothetical protein
MNVIKGETCLILTHRERHASNFINLNASCLEDIPNAVKRVLSYPSYSTYPSIHTNAILSSRLKI